MANSPILSRRRLIPFLVFASAASVLLLGQVPLTTRQGVNFHVSSHTIPAYAKMIGFLHRHYEYQALAEKITRNCASSQECATAIFSWTRLHILPTPQGYPIVDDHILHIIIRGYGQDDQMADVFTTLSTYAGIPAFWAVFRAAPAKGSVVLSFVEVDGQWTVMDVARGLVFRRPDGQLASVEELQADKSIITAAAGSLRLHGNAYVDYLSLLALPEIPHPFRAELQMPGPRVWFELGRLLGYSAKEGHYGLE